MVDSDGPTSNDPHVIRSIAVTVDDIVTALEANHRTDRTAVLRITPPFNGRMRARIHIAGGEGKYGTAPVEPIHIDPSTFVDTVPAYPEVDETAEQLVSGYSVEKHYESHTKAVSAWRETVTTELVDSITIETPTGTHSVRVAYLGR